MPSRASEPVGVPEPPRPHLASVAEQIFTEDDELFHTQLVQQSPTARPWRIRWSDGTTQLLSGAVVLGRNPVAPPGVAAAAISVDDPYRSVSKTHALLELRDGMPRLTDLSSTNGTTVTNEVGEAVVCDPGVSVPLGDGWTAGLGEFSLLVEREPAPH